MIRKANATWKGGLKSGTGVVSTETKVLSGAKYNFVQRFENEPGTNPEELVAAAHAACYAMALSAALEKNNMTPESVDVSSSLTFEKLDVGFTTTRIHLEAAAKVPGASQEAFLKTAEDAKRTCPISRLLNTTITLEAKLV